MAREDVAPSIEIGPDSELWYQGKVNFLAEPGRLKGSETELILVTAYGEDGAMIYRELARDVEPFDVILGGGSSVWVAERPDTAASCEAALFIYSRQGGIRLVAGPIAFEAAAGPV